MPGDWRKRSLEYLKAELEVAGHRLSSRGCSKFPPARPQGVRPSRWTRIGLHGRIQAARGVTMATAAKRQLALPAALSKELDQIARREGKSAVAVLQDLVSENKHNRLGQEYRAIQGYWSKKAKAKGILTARDLQRYLTKP